MTDSPLCMMCKKCNESVLHVIRDCTKAVEVWKNLVPVNSWDEFFGADLNDWILSNMCSKAYSSHDDTLPWSIIFVTTCWCMWRERNEVIFNGKSKDCRQLWFAIIHLAHEIKNGNEKIAKLRPSLGGIFRRKIGSTVTLVGLVRMAAWHLVVGEFCGIMLAIG